MSSLTKEEFIEELKLKGYIQSYVDRNGDSSLDNFIDKALRAYSDRLPQVMKSLDNAITGLNLAYPTNAIKITNIIDSSIGKDVDYVIENIAGVKSIKVGYIRTSEVDQLLENEFYDSPSSSASKSSYATSLVDIEYTISQTIESISDYSLEAIECYVEYQIYDALAGNMLEEVANSENNVLNLTDTAPNGSTTQIIYDPKTMAAKRYTDLSRMKLERFKELVEIPYLVRG